MSETMSTGSEAWPCPHCLEPLDHEVTDGQVNPDKDGFDLLLDLPAGWVCNNDDCPTRKPGYHPDEGAKQRVLMLHQASEGTSSPGTSHGG